MSIQPITDQVLIADALDRLREMYEDVGLPCWAIRDDWLQGTDAVAMVVVTGYSPDPEQFPALLRALASADSGTFLAVQCGSYDYLPKPEHSGVGQYFTVDADTASLATFVEERIPLNFALLPTSGVGWTVWLDRDEFMVIAGPRSFVEAYAGGEMPALIDEFREYIETVGIWRDDESGAPWMRHLQWMQDSVGDTRPLPPVISSYELSRARRDTAE